MKLSTQNAPLAATAVVCCGLYAAAAMKFDNFATLQVLVNLMTDNAVLGIAAAGLTLVILSGGIDLSVGAVAGLASIGVSVLVEKRGLHPAAAWLIALSGGMLMGAAMGWFIQACRLPAFLVTLAGMFLARGLALVTSLESIPLNHPLYGRIGDVSIPIGHTAAANLVPFVYLVVIAVMLIVANKTRFGRNAYALGGGEDAAFLMGLPVARTRIIVYAISGACAALAGVMHTVYGSSGSATAATGLELDAIAAAVIGGTLLTGGVGGVAGTFLGVLIFGIIHTGISFQGTLNSWWTKIVIAILLLGFILLQKMITRVGAAQSSSDTP